MWGGGPQGRGVSERTGTQRSPGPILQPMCQVQGTCQTGGPGLDYRAWAEPSSASMGGLRRGPGATQGCRVAWGGTSQPGGSYFCLVSLA
jgi:hypothetical protein